MENSADLVSSCLGLVGFFFLLCLSLLFMFGLAVIPVCGLLLQALPNVPRCVRDAPQILIHVGASEAKRSEAVVWGLLVFFFLIFLCTPHVLVLLSFLFVACS